VPGFTAFALLCAFLMFVGTLIYNQASHVTTVRPMLGVALAVCLIWGRAVLWRVVIATLIAGVAVKVAYGSPISESLLSSSLLSASVLAIYLLSLRHLNHASIDFRNWRHMVLFMASAIIIPTIAGLAFAAPDSWILNKPFWPALELWVVPSTLSYAIYTPLIVLAATMDRVTIARLKYRIAGCILLLCGALAANLVPYIVPLTFIIPLALMIMGLVCEIEGAALGLLITEIVMTVTTATGHGLATFSQLPLALQLNATQMFVAATTLALLPIAAAVTQSRQLSAKLADALRREEKISSDLRAGEQRYRQLADNASDLIVQTSMDGKVVYASPSLKRVLGYKPEETSGQIGYSIILEEDRHIMWVAREQLLRNKEPNVPVTMRYRAYRQDGHIIWLENRQSLLQDPNGQPAGFLAMLRDITDRKIIEDELVAARDQADAANRAKSEFLANMSHELRTPLNAILGFSEILAGQLYGPLGQEKYVEYAEDVHKSGAHLLELINDVLDLSKIDAGKIELHESSFSVSDLIDDAVLLARGRAKNSIKLEVFVRDDIHILADKRLTKQIVINLLSNAIKFAPAGGIVTVGAQVGHGGGLEIYVADTGIGMDATQLETAFSPYGQVNSKIAEVHQGTGLGLPIARSMARLQGGDVIAQSAPGHGTRMSLILPENRIVEPTGVPRLLAQSVR